MNSYYIVRINEAINLLIDIKNILRQITPTFTIDFELRKKIKNSLTKLTNILLKLNKNFEIKFSPKLDKLINFKEKIKEKFFVVSSPKNRKKLINLGFDPTQILSTGGAIASNDIKTLNPNITESGLKQFQNKIQKFWKILKSKLREGRFHELIIIIEKENPADIVLLNRKNELEEKLAIAIQSITISSFSELDNRFLSLINN